MSVGLIQETIMRKLRKNYVISCQTQLYKRVVGSGCLNYLIKRLNYMQKIAKLLETVSAYADTTYLHVHNTFAIYTIHSQDRHTRHNIFTHNISLYVHNIHQLVHTNNSTRF